MDEPQGRNMSEPREIKVRPGVGQCEILFCEDGAFSTDAVLDVGE